MKKMILLIALILLLTKPGQDQEFIKSELTILDVCHYDITVEDSVRFTIRPLSQTNGRRIYDVWNGELWEVDK